MPLTQLDDISALVVIDLQKGIVGIPTAQPAGEIVARAARLAQAFRARGLPVVLVNVAGRAPGRTESEAPKVAFTAEWSELVPELAVSHTDVRITKQRWRTERAYQDLKGELGLDHFEGRTYPGWQHHISVVLACYAFVLSVLRRTFPPSDQSVGAARTLDRAPGASLR